MLGFILTAEGFLGEKGKIRWLRGFFTYRGILFFFKIRIFFAWGGDTCAHTLRGGTHGSCTPLSYLPYSEPHLGLTPSPGDSFPTLGTPPLRSGLVLPPPPPPPGTPQGLLLG